MRVLQIIPFSSCKGGTQYSTLRIINHINEYSDIEIVLLTFCDISEIGDLQSNIKIYQSNLNLFKKKHIRITQMPAFIKIVKGIITDENIDVIHYNLHTLLYVDILFNRGKVPFVWTDRSIYSQYRNYAKIILRMILKFTKSVLVTTTKYNKKLWRMKKIKAKYIPNTVNVNKSKRQKEYNAESQIKIVQIGRIDRNKRYEIGINVAEMLTRDYAKKVVLDIYGSISNYRDDKSYKNYLDSLINKKNMYGIVRFKGYLKPRYLSMILSEYTVHLITSAEESFGRTIVESFKACLPVVSSHTIGASELIRNNHNGCLVNQDDPYEYCKCILKIQENAQLKKRIINNALQSVRQHYSSNELNKYCEIYKDLINKSQ